MLSREHFKIEIDFIQAHDMWMQIEAGFYAVEIMYRFFCSRKLLFFRCLSEIFHIIRTAIIYWQIYIHLRVQNRWLYIRQMMAIDVLVSYIKKWFYKIKKWFYKRSDSSTVNATYPIILDRQSFVNNMRNISKSFQYMDG